MASNSSRFNDYLVGGWAGVSSSGGALVGSGRGGGFVSGAH
ncbi:MAG: hypothetical protein WAK17_12715 [Candidatus Nitrosopolaris sp.]